MYWLGFNMQKEPMNNLEFRQAVAYALNREAYVQQLNGLGIAGNSVIGPKVFGYDEASNDVGYEYNLEKAKELVEKNGFGDNEYTLLVANRANYMKMAEISQSQLQEAGFKIKIETMEWATYLDTTRTGDYELSFLSWSNSTADGSELLYPNFHSDNVESSNKVKYSNETFDKLVEESRESVDQNVRAAKLKEANEFLVKDAPAIVMNHGVVTLAYDKSVKGLDIDPTGTWSLYKVYRE